MTSDLANSIYSHTYIHTFRSLFYIKVQSRAVSLVEVIADQVSSLPYTSSLDFPIFTPIPPFHGPRVIASRSSSMGFLGIYHTAIIWQLFEYLISNLKTVCGYIVTSFFISASQENKSSYPFLAVSLEIVSVSVADPISVFNDDSIVWRTLSMLRPAYILYCHTIS